MKKRKKTRRHLKIKSFLILVLILAIIIGVFLYLRNLRIKNIYIKGNSTITDNEIITASLIKDYPKIMKYSSKTIKKNIAKLSLVDKVSVKKNVFGKVTITISEAKVLFFDRNKNCYILSNEKEINDGNYTGIPFLVNFVPDTIYKRLIKELQKLQDESLQMISELEYSPSKSGDITIDDTRFLLRMNDGNEIYINLINIDRLNTYPLIYTVLTEKGALWLDSDNDRVVFKSYKSMESEQEKEEESEN